MGWRVEEEGGSECRPGIGRIRVEPSDEITLRESGLTSLWCLRTREPWSTDSGRQADMSAAEMPAGAAPERTPDWHSIDWRKVWHTVRRLQIRERPPCGFWDGNASAHHTHARITAS